MKKIRIVYRNSLQNRNALLNTSFVRSHCPAEGVRGGGIRIQGQLRVVGVQVGWAWEPLGEHVGRLTVPI
ncbi:hypothetical protein H8959_000087 [Pygathrix nigripes]